MDRESDHQLLPLTSALLVEVGLGALAIASHPKRLMTPALGSCVAVTLWDPARRCGALGHVMLPSPGSTTTIPDSPRFASWAVPELIRLLVESGSRHTSLRAKIAGGAAMFRGENAATLIGERNVAEVRYQLDVARIPLCGEDVGGSHARTVEILLDSGVVLVRSYKFGTRQL
jgi:chemotaxis protein CheD